MTGSTERESKKRKVSPSPSPTTAFAPAGKDRRDDTKAAGRVLLNQYEGWSPSEPKDLEVPVLRVDQASWQTLFSDYVSQRKPVVIQGSLGETESSWQVDTLWSLSYLKETAGETELFVEHRTEDDSDFGKGNRQRMAFKDFLSEIEVGSEDYYMTSQDSSEEKLFTSPLSELYQKGDFPLRPAILSGLVPSRINMWMGCSRAASGSSSGLHHDYHDNLYVLVKGNKSFDLYSPKYASHMKTHGAATRVHPNGLINYEGYETNADGTTAHDRRVSEIKRKIQEAEGKLHLLEQQEGCDQEKLEAAERELDEALELELEISMLEESDDQQDSQEKEEEEEEEEKSKGQVRVIASNKKRDQPPNFSGLMEEEQKQLREKCLGLQVHLSAGQMLYLPCGWFHNVTSRNAAPHTYHLAFNYWFYPPDNLGTDPKAPYTCTPLSPETG